MVGCPIANAQACFFFNNGCDISCDECDGQTGQVVNPRFNWTGPGPVPPYVDPTGHGFVATNTNASASRSDGTTGGLQLRLPCLSLLLLLVLVFFVSFFFGGG